MSPAQHKPFLESLLQNHGLGSSLPSVLPLPRETLPTGIYSLDEQLSGGFPRGHISEIVGPVSSGKTSLLLALLAQSTQRGEPVAHIDCNALDPHAADRSEVDLKKLLWVRCRQGDQILKAADILCRAGNFGVISLDMRAPVGPVSPRSRDDTDPVLATPRAQPAQLWRGRSRPPSMDCWFRLQRAVEGTRTVLLVITARSQARHAARLCLKLRRRELRWIGRQPFWKLLQGFSVEACTGRPPM